MNVPADDADIDTTAVDFGQAEPGRDIFDKKANAKSEAHAVVPEEPKDDAPEAAEADAEVGNQEDEAERARKELFPDEVEA